jgi:glutamate-ammonia-ligase adenylyltransferase
MLISQPELSDFLLKSNEGLMTTRAGMSVELSRQIAEVERFADKMDILRRFKHEEELRIGIRDIFTNPGYRSVSADLTSLAEVVIEQALKIAEEDMRTKYPMPETPATGIAVAGFGKLGTGELGYGSDLDIIFVYHEPDSAGTGCAIGWQEFYARLSERVIFALSSLTRSGFVFRVDTRLRPGGSKGVLAHTIEGLSRYYGSAASVWELQALTRARAVAGDAKAREAFDALRLNILGKPRDEELIRQEVRSMRERIERELGRPGKGGGIHIKHGRGGFLDIEFIVQYIQLTKGPECPELLNPDTASTLGVIISKGLLKGGDELPGMYAFLKELESRLRITTSQPETLIPDDRVKLEILASRMGYAVHGPEAADRLFNDYSRIAKAVRDIYNRIFN